MFFRQKKKNLNVDRDTRSGKLSTKCAPPLLGAPPYSSTSLGSRQRGCLITEMSVMPSPPKPSVPGPFIKDNPEQLSLQHKHSGIPAQWKRPGVPGPGGLGWKPQGWPSSLTSALHIKESVVTQDRPHCQDRGPGRAVAFWSSLATKSAVD